jgi:hypothetical protein
MSTDEKDDAAWPFVPRTPEQIVEFVGCNFHSHRVARDDGTPLPLEDQSFYLSVHDLLSAFDAAGFYEDEAAAGGDKRALLSDEQIDEIAAWFVVTAGEQR